MLLGVAVVGACATRPAISRRPTKLGGDDPPPLPTLAARRAGIAHAAAPAQGLHEHPYVHMVDTPRLAEFVVYLPVSSKLVPNETSGATPDKVLVLDEVTGDR